MILARGNDEHPALAARGDRLTEKFHVVVERVVPAAPFPRHGPSFFAVRVRTRAFYFFDEHVRFGYRPRFHGLRAHGVLRDDGLQYAKAKPRLRVLLHLMQSKRELTGRLAERVLHRETAVTAGEI